MVSVWIGITFSFLKSAHSAVRMQNTDWRRLRTGGRGRAHRTFATPWKLARLQAFLLAEQQSSPKADTRPKKVALQPHGRLPSCRGKVYWRLPAVLLPVGDALLQTAPRIGKGFAQLAGQCGQLRAYCAQPTPDWSRLSQKLAEGADAAFLIAALMGAAIDARALMSPSDLSAGGRGSHLRREDRSMAHTSGGPS